MKTTEQMWLDKRWTGAWIAAVAMGLVSWGPIASADETGGEASGKSTMIFGEGLEDLRGGDAQTTISIQNSQDLTASVEAVTISADSILTGAINIGEHALDNFSGVGTFNLVTGNNNAVNSAVEVTFTLE